MTRLHNIQYAGYGQGHTIHNIRYTYYCQCCVMHNALYACYDTATQYTIRMLWPGPCNTQYTIKHMLWPGLNNTQYTCYCQACAIHSIRGDTIPTTMSPPSGRHVAWCVSLKILWPLLEAFVTSRQSKGNQYVLIEMLKGRAGENVESAHSAYLNVCDEDYPT